MTTKLSMALLMGAALAISACSDSSVTGVDNDMSAKRGKPTPTSPAPTTSPTTGNPLSGITLYVEPTNSALTQASLWRSTRPADADLMDKIGHTSQALWFGGWSGDIQSAVSRVVTSAASLGAVPVLVAYNIPQRDCGSYSAGGSTSADAYRTWIRGFAAGIGSRRAVVILEPDALAGIGCLSTTDADTRYALFQDAVNVLKANAGTAVYLDGGHARWIASSTMAARLTRANVAAADGFALDVSNYIWSDENATYGASVSSLIGGKHFVIDTSRNGQGPTSTNEWCNPSGRGLGIAPTTATGNSLVDALLWIKRPGESDGTCNGGPSAGSWWADYALGLAQHTTTQLALSSSTSTQVASN